MNNILVNVGELPGLPNKSVQNNAFEVYNLSFEQWNAAFGVYGFTSPIAYLTTPPFSPYQYMAISPVEGNFTALQLQVASGYGLSLYGYWESYMDGQKTGSSAFEVQAPFSPTWIGFSGGTFDQLRIGVFSQPFSTFDFTPDITPGYPPVGGFSDGDGIIVTTIETGVVPEPSAWAMMLLGFAGLGYAGYRRGRVGHATLAA